MGAARLHGYAGAVVQAAEVVTADSLKEIRAYVPEGCVMLDRDPADAPAVFEAGCEGAPESRTMVSFATIDMDQRRSPSAAN